MWWYGYAATNNWHRPQGLWLGSFILQGSSLLPCDHQWQALHKVKKMTKKTQRTKIYVQMSLKRTMWYTEETTALVHVDPHLPSKEDEFWPFKEVIIIHNLRDNKRPYRCVTKLAYGTLERALESDRFRLKCHFCSLLDWTIYWVSLPSSEKLKKIKLTPNSVENINKVHDFGKECRKYSINTNSLLLSLCHKISAS